ncbi:MAG: hypothetical protein P8P87_04250 [Crocinitomicaceae bacterium]|nr:hypothetical protein [Crocinitomicaceae bacterium]|tara:strand:+ start:5150 stop:5488 length:339 start_codon:yes stop_codon:yes gene_type:complete
MNISMNSLIISEWLIIKIFVRLVEVPFLFNLKLITVSLLLLSLLFTSCKSEYEERLEEVKELKEKITMVEASNSLLPKERLINEIENLEDEISFLAKVSGNEKLFLAEVHER